MRYYIVVCQVCKKQKKVSADRFKCCGLLQSTLKNKIAEGEEQKLMIVNQKKLLKKQDKMEVKFT